jgi:outer membrane murein-binding lipoprotein Lpp
MIKNFLLAGMLLAVIAGCQPNQKQDELSGLVQQTTVDKLIEQLTQQYGDEQAFRIERGVKAVANLWRSSDGSLADFEEFCQKQFIADEEKLGQVFDRLEANYESLYGYMNRITLELNRQLHEDKGQILPVDQMFGAYSPSAHLQDDFYNNKIAFVVALNFPNYSLEEKNELGAGWTAREWGYARLGDLYTARIPASVLQDYNQVSSKARLYISEYNIFAGKLVDNEGNTLFPEQMKLLSHWNIRDEIKSNYDRADGLAKQEMLYKVMLRIINQDIPKEVINNPDYLWNPYENTLMEGDKAVEFEKEETVRYEHLLAIFNGLKQMDAYYPNNDNYIKRRFDNSMEISQDEVETLFREYASSPLLRDVAALISQRLGRELRPFDLWYNGFVGRGGIGEEELDRITKKRYPTAKAMEADLERMQKDLGFDDEMAKFLASRIEVDAARGSGHAWRASMRSKPSHLRTRVAADGMDYKGYNIAVHELGHNIEQTISVHFVDNYFVNGIPNTAFTEAIAFMYQSRDLELLGVAQPDPQKAVMEVLDIFWDNYEMMGVSLVDMEVWKWLYANPDADAEALKQAVLRISKSIWNEYYADIFGEADNPLLAIYSHMIQSPLYLMNYPYGRLIMFQLEDYISDKSFADEMLRIYSIGRLTPQHWMDKAVGGQISNRPISTAVEAALKTLK